MRYIYLKVCLKPTYLANFPHVRNFPSLSLKGFGVSVSIMDDIGLKMWFAWEDFDETPIYTHEAFVNTMKAYGMWRGVCGSGI